MTPSARYLAILCQKVYDGKPEDWDHWLQVDGVVAGVKKLDGCDVVVFRGSHTAEDWVRDAEAWPVWHGDIGFCHAGFVDGLDETFAAIAPLVGDRVFFTGHSLGGARARLQAAHFVVNGRKVAGVTVFGSPRPAFANAARVLQKSGTPLASYRNRADPVPLVPYLGGLYVHPDEATPINCAPSETDLDPLRDHAIEHYIKGVTP